MRNRNSRKLITSLLTATIAGVMAMSIMPEIRCSTNNCVVSVGDKCRAGDEILWGYKFKIGFDG